MARYTAPTIDDGKSLVQTRVPQALRVYLRAYAKHHNLKMEELLAEVLQHFLDLRPDLRGLHWRVPQSHRSEAASDAGWAQINVLVANDIAGKVAGLANQLGISRAALVYTALYWFARYMRPAVSSEASATDMVNAASGAAHG